MQIEHYRRNGGHLGVCTRLVFSKWVAVCAVPRLLLFCFFFFSLHSSSFLQFLDSCSQAMPWEDAESLHKQLHAAFGCGRPPALRKFVDEISDFLRPTGLKVRKVFCDGSRSSTAFLILHSEAEEELPVSLSALRTLQRVSKKFSLTQLHIFQAAASYLLRTRQPLTLLQWIRLCQAKGGCAPSLLQSLLELQFLRVENAEGDPTQLRLVLGPWCYA
ncbi:putative transmembrane protein, partial [Toxoplasma gondii p89]